ncbi:uncharacterized protein LOC129262148 [Lytechinus pictus]|uniref:uncharacterized protein LOC129262148 n=1 Tax=Lytechinus pictus TaxID=7653 RepID=UPI0030B9CE1E
MVYDVCVVGAGMVGSAAAKWLCKLQQDTKICLIGPLEPTEKEWEDGRREVFASHYDEGRVTRELDADYTWGLLGKRSIQRYKEIEQESGINFYHEVGCAFIDTKGNQNMQNFKETARKLAIQHEIFNCETFQEKFPYLRVNHDSECIWTAKRAGHISPRKLVAAQQKIASSLGCDVIHEVVTTVSEVTSQDGDTVMRVLSESGRVIFARRVLLCTGAFTNFHSILPKDRKLDFNMCKTFVVKAELSEQDAMKMSAMPSMLLDNKNCYVLPPIKYPDGKYYLKLGLWFSLDNQFDDIQGAAEWFRSHGRNYDTSKTLDVLRELVPDIRPLGLTTNSCIASITPTGQLFCDMINPRLGVLIGMNGLGAKCSNEIGRMGASMISKGTWNYDLNPDLFKVQYKKNVLQGKL